MKNLVVKGMLVLSLALGGQTAAVASEEISAESDKATVVVYRVKQNRTKNISFQLFTGNEGQGRLQPNGYAIVAMEPGTHQIWSNMKSSEPLVITVKAGEQVFVDASLSKRNGKYRTEFNVVSSVEAVDDLPALAKYTEGSKLAAN